MPCALAISILSVNIDMNLHNKDTRLLFSDVKALYILGSHNPFVPIYHRMTTERTTSAVLGTPIFN